MGSRQVEGMSPMRETLVTLALLFIGLPGCAPDMTTFDRLTESEFVPPAGRGRVVIVVSGSAGSGSYRFAARDLAAQGYYVVLHSGNDFPYRHPPSPRAFRQAGLRAPASPPALPG